MKRKLLLIGAVVALVVAAAVGWYASPASAHNQDNNSLWGCAATVQGSNYSIDHSWWDGLYTDLATGRCMAHDNFTGHQRCWRLTWWYPGKPNQSFAGSGYDDSPPCWFSEP